VRYRVRGLKSGAVLELELQARDELDATGQAESRGVAVLSVQQRGMAWLPARRDRFPLRLFSQELLSLLESGIGLVESLLTLAEKETRPAVRAALDQLTTRLREGLALSQAMQENPAAFPTLYVAAVKASERTGDLPEALRRYVAYQSQIDLLRSKIVSAALYPAMLVGVGGLVTLFLIGYVVPRFSQIYEDMGNQLPWLSTVLLACGRFMEQHALAVAAGMAAAAIMGARWIARGEAALMLGRWLPRIPAVGERYRLYQLARFYRTLGMLLNGGIAIVPALSMVEGLVEPVLRRSLERAARLVREGQPLSQAVDSCGLATPVALRMLRVGEHSGRMGEMMERIAAFYDEEMARWVDWFTRLFEPLLMLVIGLIIGGVVLLLYLPIFELAGSIQ
jgi:general secretion pathway protein F